jgi:hypothetical protein
VGVNLKASFHDIDTLNILNKGIIFFFVFGQFFGVEPNDTEEINNLADTDISADFNHG